jgi:hypothetical protein
LLPTLPFAFIEDFFNSHPCYQHLSRNPSPDWDYQELHLYSG